MLTITYNIKIKIMMSLFMAEPPVAEKLAEVVATTTSDGRRILPLTVS